MSDSSHEPGWYADPFGRHEMRYYDGTQWTEHVSSHGRQSTDAPVGDPKQVVGTHRPDKVQRQVGDTAAAFAGDCTIHGEPILVVNQKAKLIERVSMVRRKRPRCQMTWLSVTV